MGMEGPTLVNYVKDTQGLALIFIEFWVTEHHLTRKAQFRRLLRICWMAFFFLGVHELRYVAFSEQKGDIARESQLTNMVNYEQNICISGDDVILV